MRSFGGTWSELKLDRVERYIVSYLRVMQYQRWATLHYVDAFAGRGRQALRAGSAIGNDTTELDSFFGDEAGQLSRWFRRAHARSYASVAALMDQASDGLCEFHG